MKKTEFKMSSLSELSNRKNSENEKIRIFSAKSEVPSSKRLKSNGYTEVLMEKIKKDLSKSKVSFLKRSQYKPKVNDLLKGRNY